MIVGISGNIGSGKSTVGKYIASKGYVVFDADLITHELYAKNSTCYDKVVDLLSPCILDENGEINRSQISTIIFKDDLKRKALEQLLHQAILEELQVRSTKERNKVIFWEVPLLFEVGWQIYVDCIIYVVSNRESVIKRVMNRSGLSEEAIVKRLDLQMDATSLLRDNDFLIHNDRDLAHLYLEIDKALVQIDHCVETQDSL